ncbi:MAG: NAD-binding protein, partial [Alphaproteobacteria bacterium]|nr:NAD-binding protein [Alphaproteobacteria bacterium]
MKVLVCGAGEVGFNIARHLADEDNDVVVIDHSRERIQKVGKALDVQALMGYASHPDMLMQGGAGDADMLIAVTQSDEI